MYGKPHRLFTASPNQFGKLHAVCPHDDDVPWRYMLEILYNVGVARLRVDKVYPSLEVFHHDKCPLRGSAS